MSIRYLIVSAAIILAIISALMWIVEGRIDVRDLLRVSAIAFAVAMLFRAVQYKRTQS